MVFGGRAYDHMLPEDSADMVGNLGHPRLDLPVGHDDVNALGLDALDSLMVVEPDEGRSELRHWSQPGPDASAPDARIRLSVRE